VIFRCWDQAHGLMHARKMLYHWVNPQPCLSEFKCFYFLEKQQKIKI
jgi:hypothetical protein